MYHIHNRNEFYFKTKNYGEVYFDNPIYDDNGIKGLPMHTECWDIAKNRLNHKLTYEDFIFNKYNKLFGTRYYLFKNIDYGLALKYNTQFWEDNIIINLNKDNYFIK